MRRSLVPILDCPTCRSGDGLRLARVDGESREGSVFAGVLACDACSREFEIRDGIPDLVVDGLRGLAEPTPHERRVLAEGVHWGLFMQRFWDVGDRSIFDVRVRGTHPPFFVAGCLERDDRDARRRFGWWPDHLSGVVFPWLSQHAGSWGVDVGCGGGQFGLEAARQGVRMVGFDPSMLALQLAARHAAEERVEIDYVRAEPGHPPFRPGKFSLMVVKDALHHVPDLYGAFPGLVALLRPRAEIALYEHIGKSRLRRRVMDALAPRLVERIRRRYPRVPVPAELLADSANEDVSMPQVEPAVRAAFEAIAERQEIFLYFELEMMAHFAFGKRGWLSRAVRRAVYTLETLAMACGARPEHWAFRGRLRGQ